MPDEERKKNQVSFATMSSLCRVSDSTAELRGQAREADRRSQQLMGAADQAGREKQSIIEAGIYLHEGGAMIEEEVPLLLRPEVTTIFGRPLLYWPSNPTPQPLQRMIHALACYRGAQQANPKLTLADIESLTLPFASGRGQKRRNHWQSRSGGQVRGRGGRRNPHSRVILLFGGPNSPLPLEHRFSRFPLLPLHTSWHSESS